jgi:predicted AlkP superfamily pyrophosphatase or phosphodiesterase
MRKLIFAVLAFAGPAFAQPAPPPLPAGAPKLVVVISVDQFSADLWDEYRPHFTGGLARLAGGILFHNGYQSHAATETCPGHSTILTGDHPSRTGIVANSWIDQTIQRPDKNIYCAEDENAPGTSSTAYKVSSKQLLVPTLGELMKARWPGSRNVSVSGKDRAAVMMSGHKADQRWYWNAGKFDTDLAGASIPQIVVKANAAITAAMTQSRPALEPPPYCQAKAHLVAVEGGGKPVGMGQFARAAADVTALRASPELDGDTLAIAAGLIDEMQLGKRAEPDVLAVSLSATDYVGHTYGTEGEEMCLQLLELDREIGDFLAVLDSRGIDYSVVLTADHGGKDIPERERAAGVADAARIDPALGATIMGRKLVAQLGLTGPGLLRNFGDMYIDRNLLSRDRKRLLDAAVAAYRAHPQVEAVFTAAEIAATPIPTLPPDQWNLIQRVRANHYPGRSGDFFIILKKDITPISDTSGYVATHGSPWDYDRRVPILFWRKGMAPVASDSVIETTDIMPTLAATLGLPLAPGSIDGRCLAEVAICPTGAPNPSERGY